jgi:serine/threonine-protein kinase
VPDVVGQDMASGAGQIEAAGFVAETAPVTSASAPDGQIVQEAPAAGSQAPAGSIVQLQVAAGSSQSQVQVPNVVGQKAGSARAALLQAKLTARTEYRKGPKTSAGVVLAQTPAAGSSAAAYTQVTLTVGQ